MSATHEDATVIMQLVQWATAMGLDEAMSALFADDFDAATASLADPPVRKMLTFGETVSTLTKHGVLDEELVEDLWWIDGAWSRVGPAALNERTRLGEPRLFENFEALATKT
jgi:hypothetical protein